MISFVLLIVLMPAQTLPNDCVVGAVDPAFPVLSARKSLKLDREKNELTETARIGKDVELVVESGGCYHYGVKLTFTLPLSPRTARPLLEEAAELMSKARLKDRLVADVIPRLRKRSKEPYVNGEPIHDTEHEMETIYVSEELGKNARRVIVTYSNTL